MLIEDDPACAVLIREATIRDDGSLGIDENDKPREALILDNARLLAPHRRGDVARILRKKPVGIATAKRFGSHVLGLFGVGDALGCGQSETGVILNANRHVDSRGKAPQRGARGLSMSVAKVLEVLAVALDCSANFVIQLRNNASKGAAFFAPT